MPESDPYAEAREALAALADSADELVRIHQELLGQPVSDQAREWLADVMMSFALSADANRAWARSDLDTGNELAERARHYMDRTRGTFYIGGIRQPPEGP